MTHGPPDESLFVKYRADGDLEAFGRLYDRYGPAIFRFLLRLLHDRPAAEDLTQQVFLRVHESRGAFDARRSFRTWIFTIARRLAVNCAARSGSAASEEDPPDLEDEAPSPEHRAIVRDEARAVERALSSLSRDDAEVLLLAKYEGLSYEEIPVRSGARLRAWGVVAVEKEKGEEGLKRGEALEHGEAEDRHERGHEEPDVVLSAGGVEWL